jgi:DNA-binding transcriptional MerR regulator
MQTEEHSALPGEVGLSIGEAARRLGASVHTLRYYEREGLLNVPRLDRFQPELARHAQVGNVQARSAQRRYGEGELDLLRFLLALRATGMPIRLIRRYMALVRLGDGTVTERRDLLVEHQRAVTAQIAALQDNLKAIELKIGKYDLIGGCAPTASSANLPGAN